MANNKQSQAVPSYLGPLAQFASPDGFGAAAFMRARNTGLTDREIKGFVDDVRRQGMQIGERVNVALDPATYGSDLANRPEIDKYISRAVFLPKGSSAGGAQNVVWAAGPMTDQQIYNFFGDKPREDWVLPPSVNKEGDYQAPEGVNYIDRRASAADQMRAAAAGFDAFMNLGASADSPVSASSSSAPSPLAGRKFRSIKDAFNAAQQSSQRFDQDDIRALSKSTGESKVDVVRKLRRARDEAGATGGVLTKKARKKFRASKEKQSGLYTSDRKPERQETNTSKAKEKYKKAKKAAQKAKNKLKKQKNK